MLREISAAGRSAAFALTLATALSACGIKGPLKLPPAPPAAPDAGAPASAPAAPAAAAPAADAGTPAASSDGGPGKKP